MILGNVEGFFSVGELRHFWEHASQNTVSCGCGTVLTGCTFWNPVVHEVSGKLSMAGMTKLNRRLNRTRISPWIATGIASNLDPYRKLVSGTETLYRIVSRRTDHQVIVDSSKVPSHLDILRRIPSIDIRVLHLVRDGRAVAYSWSKRAKQEPRATRDGSKALMPQRSAVLSVLRWEIENICAVILSSSLPYTVVRYEDFARRPHTELRRALDDLGFQTDDLDWLARRTISLRSTHSVGGNPVRFTRSPISIALDDEWQCRMRFLERLLLGLIGLPVLLHFGYGLGT
jgi:hypothetical protein